MKVKNAFSGHLPALDGVRGLAIGLVLWVHFVGDFPKEAGDETLLDKIFFQLGSYGTFGVDLFFVLSGFLITGILFDSKADPHFFKNFYMRRTLRIFPLYYGVLAVIFLGLRWIPFFQGAAMDEMVARQGWAWAYAVNIHIAREGTWSLPYLGHFWSLAVEEHFYFLWPLIVYYLPRGPLLKTAAAFVVGSMGLRMAMAYAGVNDLAQYTLTPCRFDALCIGAFLSIYARTQEGNAGFVWLKKTGWRLLLVSAAVIVASFAFTRLTHSGQEFFRPLRATLFAACFGSIVAFALTSSPTSLVGKFFLSAPMRWLGKYSYGLYVFHAMISYDFMFHHRLDDVKAVIPNHYVALAVLATVGLALSAGGALLSFHFYEKRFLTLKERFEAKPSPS